MDKGLRSFLLTVVDLALVAAVIYVLVLFGISGAADYQTLVCDGEEVTRVITTEPPRSASFSIRDVEDWPVVFFLPEQEEWRVTRVKWYGGEEVLEYGECHSNTP